MCVDPKTYDRIADRFGNIRRSSESVTKEDFEKLKTIIEMFNGLEDVYKENVTKMLSILREKKTMSALIDYAKNDPSPLSKKITATIGPDEAYTKLMATGMYLGLKSFFPDFFSEQFGSEEYFMMNFGVQPQQVAGSLRNINFQRNGNVFRGAGACRTPIDP